jgi:hypothetical protein
VERDVTFDEMTSAKAKETAQRQQMPQGTQAAE